jgi:hypothetical protein
MRLIPRTNRINCVDIFKIIGEGECRGGYYDFYKNFQTLKSYCTDFAQSYQAS